MSTILNRLIRLLLQLSVFALLVAETHAQENDERRISQALSVAAYSAHGGFGLDLDTDIIYFPLRYELDRGNWGFQLLAPHLEVDGPGAVLINLGGVNRAVAGSLPRRESGLGDVVASAIYRVDPISPTAPFVDFRLDVKLPTAEEERGLGTGETDYNLQFDLSRYWGQWAVFATLGYSFRGNSALFPDIESGAYAQFGAALPLQDTLSLGFIVDYREAASSFTTDIQEFGPYLNWQFSDNWSLSGLAMTGFTDSSVDFSVLAQLRYSW